MHADKAEDTPTNRYGLPFYLRPVTQIPLMYNGINVARLQTYMWIERGPPGGVKQQTPQPSIYSTQQVRMHIDFIQSPPPLLLLIPEFTGVYIRHPGTTCRCFERNARFSCQFIYSLASLGSICTPSTHPEHL